MKIVHLTPTYFSTDSIMGGAERYVDELAQAQSHYAQVKIVSFGNQSKTFKKNNVEYVIIKPLFYLKKNKLNPISFKFIKEYFFADVIHCHQIFTIISEVSILTNLLLRKKIYLTDHGGGGVCYLMSRGLSKLATAILTVSNYSKDLLLNYNSTITPIFGGVNTNRFKPQQFNSNNEQFITVGRILPHKGFHHLIQALPQSSSLVIIGKIADSEYYDELVKLAQGKNVLFKHNLTDNELVEEITKSKMAIFPSTFIGLHQKSLSGQPELFGLAPAETMSCNVPTYVSNVGAYPELALNKDFIFEDGNIQKIGSIFATTLPTNLNFRQFIIDKLTWDHVAQRTFQAYGYGHE